MDQQAFRREQMLASGLLRVPEPVLAAVAIQPPSPRVPARPAFRPAEAETSPIPDGFPIRG